MVTSRRLFDDDNNGRDAELNERGADVFHRTNPSPFPHRNSGTTVTSRRRRTFSEQLRGNVSPTRGRGARKNSKWGTGDFNRAHDLKYLSSSNT